MSPYYLCMTNNRPRDEQLGATVTNTGVDFCVWAPDHRVLEVEFDAVDRRRIPMVSDGNGKYHAHCRDSRAGDLYRYRLDDSGSYPDPYSRSQPQGPHGPSSIVDSTRYAWRDAAWCGLDPARQILYELHIGTFTDAGTWQAASEHLESLRDLGVSCIEMMPVNEFVGGFGWGYDGVNWYAPFHAYGEPDDLRAFVDRAHALNLGVILDVVYNHFGHDGNYLQQFAAEYLTDAVQNPWGSSPNYACSAMRRLAIDNTAYWIREFHFDGLRLDAIQNIHDPAPPTLLSALVCAAREAAGSRRIVICAEDYLQRTPLLAKSGSEGADIDLLWNDDFHHVCRVASTGNHHGLFANYRGTAQEILSSLKHGFLFQGQQDGWSKEPRGFPVTSEPLGSFVAFTQNHDAVANTLHGQRLDAIVSPGKYRALTAVLLLGPQTPLLFMGQEFGASTPFAYFADYPSDTGALWNGRKQESGQSIQYRDPAAVGRVLNPCSPDTFRASTLNHGERTSRPQVYQLFCDLIGIRNRYAKAITSRDVDGAMLSENALVFRWFDSLHGDRLLIVNMGPQIELRARPEPLLAPPRWCRWQQLWSSDSPRYGGMGAIDALLETGWQMSAESACLLTATRANSP